MPMLLKVLVGAVLQRFAIKIARASEASGTCMAARAWQEISLTCDWSDFLRAIGGLYTRR
jgi:hypothetical protein